MNHPKQTEPSSRKSPPTWQHIDYAGYRKTVRDLSPNHGKVTSVPGGWKISLPNSATFDLARSAPAIEWDRRFSREHVTSSHWLRSLVYLPELAGANGEAAVATLLRDYQTYFVANAPSSSYRATNSIDHTVALNLATLTRLRSFAHQESSGVIQAVVDDLVESGFIKQLEDFLRLEEVFSYMNHGMLSMISLLSSRLFFPELENDRGDIEEDALLLMKLIRKGFDASGVSVENTPAYQQLWLHLIKQAIYLLQQLASPGDTADEVYSFAGLIEDTYRKLLLPNGYIPPLGDGVSAPNLICAQSQASSTPRELGTIQTPRKRISLHYRVARPHPCTNISTTRPFIYT